MIRTTCTAFNCFHPFVSAEYRSGNDVLNCFRVPPVFNKDNEPICPEQQ